MLKAIANRIANDFTDEDTRIITILDYTSTNALDSELKHTDNSKNLIILIDNTAILGSVKMEIRRSDRPAVMFGDSFKAPRPQNDANNREVIKHGQIKLAEIVNRLNNMNDSKTAFMYYPSYDGYVDNGDFEITKSETLTSITPKDEVSNNLLTPGGKSFLLIIEKTTDHLLCRVKRDSYVDKVCAPAVDAAKAICPSPSSPDCEDQYSSTEFWIMFAILLFIIIVLALVLGYFVLSGDSDKNKLSESPLVTESGPPTGRVELSSIEPAQI
jgi:hypothetical protein